MTQEIDVHPLVLHNGNEVAWMLYPTFLNRVAKFLRRYTHQDVGSVPAVFANLMGDFGAGTNRYLGLVLVDDAGTVHGHLLAGLEINGLTGDGFALVYQWEKDVRTNLESDKECSQLVERWAKSHDLKRLAALPSSASRARLFERFGFTPGQQVIYKEIGT